MIYYGVVEDRLSDPLKLGRCKVRITGIHTENKSELPTADLPWSMVMQPTTSGAISGLGHSPTGIVEGTWVMVLFRDDHRQCPVIIGTLPGVPTKEEAQSDAAGTPAVRSGNGSVFVDGSGQPVTSGNSEIEVKKPAEALPAAFKKPFALKTSDEGFKFLKSEEGLASLEPNRGRNPKIGSDKVSPNTTLYSYQDTQDIWTIGWGSTYLADGSRVTETTTISKAQADELKLNFIRGTGPKIPGVEPTEKSLRRLITAPLTQSMFDACVSMIYNMGAGGFQKTGVFRALNAAKYEEAAALIPSARIDDRGVLVPRRNREKALFLKDGIPQDDGSTKQVPEENQEGAVAGDATQNPVVKRQETDAQAGTDGDVKQLSEPGFADPNKVFPKYFNEPDVHRLARHENIDGTIVFKKESARASGVQTAVGGSWSQPPIPYNAKYPHNHVFVSESGHVQEFDDTEGNERIHTYHKSGTYTEIDVNGTQVNRIVGDSFQILERNGNVVIRGSCNITVQGDCNIKCDNNINLLSSGSLALKAGGDVGIEAGGSVNIKSGGDLILDSGASLSGKAGGDASLDGAAVHLNSGKGRSATVNLTGAADGEFPALSTPNRFAGLETSYETPEDGEASEEYKQKQSESGLNNPDEAPEDADKLESQSLTKTEGAKVPVSCDLIYQESSWDYSYRLSTNFTMRDVIKGTSAEIPNGNATAGVKANAIVCNLKHLCVNILEPLKRRYPNMIITNSYRSDRHNAAVGGAKKSQHSFGEAADIQFSGFNRKQTYAAAIELHKLLPSFDQLILEYRGSSTWIHVSNKVTGNRNSALTIDASSGKNVTINRGGFTLISG